MSNAANLALDGGDPREVEFAPEGMTAARMHLVNDPTVSFEEYLYYATITRAEEKAEYDATPKEKRTVKGIIKNRFRVHHPPSVSPSPPQSATVVGDEKVALDGDEKQLGTPESAEPVQLRHYAHPSQVSDEEWKTLSRGIRTAGWSTCFYLITTDILGPFSTPYVPPGNEPANPEHC
jgi:hypothetical protein